MFPVEREKGIYDVDAHPRRHHRPRPGYIAKDDEVIVGLQTDAPLKRAIMPNGGWRMVEGASRPTATRSTRPSRDLHELPQDPQPGRLRRLLAERPRRALSHVITGLPDAYGRGRIIGDYRRVALYGVDQLIAAKKVDKLGLDTTPFTEEVVRMREEHAEQIRAFGELKQMAAAYGFDISGPATTAREAVQWLYFGYLAAVKSRTAPRCRSDAPRRSSTSSSSATCSRA
jgi:formate C-acetyltransferase